MPQWVNNNTYNILLSLFIFYLLMLLHDSYYAQRMLWEDYCLGSHVPSKWMDEVLYCYDYHHYQQQLLSFPFLSSSQKKGLWCQFLSNFNVQKTRLSRILPTKAIGAVKTNEKLFIATKITIIIVKTLAIPSSIINTLNLIILSITVQF